MRHQINARTHCSGWQHHGCDTVHKSSASPFSLRPNRFVLQYGRKSIFSVIPRLSQFTFIQSLHNITHMFGFELASQDRDRFVAFYSEQYDPADAVF